MDQLQKGKTRVYLEKHLPRRIFNGRTAVEHMTETGAWIRAVETDHHHLYNRRKYNRMDYEEQRVYEKRMAEPRTEYQMGSSKEATAYYPIQKTLFEYLKENFPERIKTS